MRYISIIFALLSYVCIHFIYSLSFQSIFSDFAVPVCLLLIVVVLYFTCLYTVYSVLNINRVCKGLFCFSLSIFLLIGSLARTNS